MADNDLELGAAWAAAAAGNEADPERLAEITAQWAAMRAADRAETKHLDAKGHRALAEGREQHRLEKQHRRRQADGEGTTPTTSP